MANLARRPTAGVIERFASRLRLPWLFFLTAIVLVVDLVVPDAIPLVDEVLLALFTVILGSLKKKRTGDGAATEEASSGDPTTEGTPG